MENREMMKQKEKMDGHQPFGNRQENLQKTFPELYRILQNYTKVSTEELIKIHLGYFNEEALLHLDKKLINTGEGKEK